MPATPLTVFPLRFTARPAAMIGFLRTLGLAPVLTAGEDAFGDLRAGAGRVMVHAASGSDTGAASGDTDLCLVVPDASAAAQQLRTEGFEVAVWDEAYGKQGVITGPGGEAIGLNEDQRDTYGHRAHDPSGADPRLVVVAVLDSDDLARDAAFFSRLGFAPAGPEVDGRLELEGPPGAGAIGLHAPRPDARRTRPAQDEFGASLQVGLAFRTAEPLEELAARLCAAGHEATVRGQGAAQAVHVTDPDGIAVEIRASAGS